MKIKKTLTMITALAIVGTAFMTNGSSFTNSSVTAYAAEDELEFEGEVLFDGIDYDVKSDHVVILDCQDSVKGELVIPETIKGRPVTEIRESAFWFCDKITAVTLPKTLKEVGYSAFSSCTSLEKVTFSGGIESIGESAFSDCKNLKEIILPDTLTKIEKKAFENCSSLEKIDLPQSLKEIGDMAFGWCSSLKEIVIPNGIEKLGTELFYEDIAIEKVTLPYIGISPCDTNTDIIDLFFGVSYGVILSYPDTDEVVYDRSTDENYIRNQQGVFIPKSFTTLIITDCDAIPDGICQGAASLKSITLPESIKSIGTGAFSFCESLEEINIPDSVTEIGDRAFMKCTSLKTINIPDSLTKFSNDMFGACESLDIKDFKISDKITYIGDSAFSGCKSMNFGSLVIPESVTYIGSRAFRNCDGLTEISFPSAFGKSDRTEGICFGCANLKKITFPISNITDMLNFQQNLFMSDTLNNDDRFYESIGYIPKSLEEIVITDGTNIPDDCFADFSSLKKITLPDTITSIGDNAFANCPNAVIIGNTGSYAETYAKENDIQFRTPDAESDEFILGDVNNDSTIDARDASAVLAEYANSSTAVGASFAPAQIKAANVNKDGTVDARDASDILRYYALSSVSDIDSFDDIK